MEFNLPSLRNSSWDSCGFITAFGQFAKNTTDSLLALNLCLNWVSTRINMHATINSESSVTWYITMGELNLF